MGTTFLGNKVQLGGHVFDVLDKDSHPVHDAKFSEFYTPGTFKRRLGTKISVPLQSQAMPSLIAGCDIRPQNHRINSRIRRLPSGHGCQNAVLLFLFAVLVGPWFGSGNLANAQTPTEGALHLGETFPRFSGTTVPGKSVQLPPDAPHGAAVLVFSFSRSAAADARSWDEHLAKDYSTDVPAEAVIVLESVPKIFRGMAVAGIQSSMPAPVQARTVILYHGERSWQQRLAVTATDRAYVLLLDRQSRIVWRNSAPYSSEQSARMREKIATLMSQP